MTLAEFCVHPRTRHMVMNYQAGYLSCPAQKDPREASKGMSAEDLAAYKLQLALDPSPEEFPAPEALFEAARNRLRSFVSVGITERLHESLTLLARRLGAPDPPQFERRNVGNRFDTVDPHTIGVIRSCTEVDYELYRSERNDFERIWKQSGDFDR